jgi:hypothetical protein
MNWKGVTLTTSKYTIESATEKLTNNKIKVDPTAKTITFVDPPGLRLLGAVDYLTHKQGYRIA